jgi:hypothetical protein
MDILTNSSIAYRSLLHKCDSSVVDKIMEYHGNYNHWKSKYSESLIHIDNLRGYCNDTIRYMGREGCKGKLWCSYNLFYDEDCSNDEQCRLANELGYERQWLMRSLLRNLKRL